MVTEYGKYRTLEVLQSEATLMITPNDNINLSSALLGHQIERSKTKTLFNNENTFQDDVTRKTATRTSLYERCGRSALKNRFRSFYVCCKSFM